MTFSEYYDDGIIEDPIADEQDQTDGPNAGASAGHYIPVNLEGVNVSQACR